ncbi:MAG: bifunctional UDP-N-acetylglucosamine diphosphorylase/glucosamine-1-phosphate N-acetyltransferase GlmU [Thomasclavelia sp.]|nr:bifunctional UDP-N-acetylglucosamine diphosphorylase/glucosamine-1-phosphate N-acetyltransferase GlmU [Thomasclavelia sp.]
MNTYAVVMAAGKGTRMKSDKPKVAHEVLYKPMICHIVDELKKLDLDKIYVIVGHKHEEVEKLVDGVEFVLQKEQLGTGHALMQCKDLLKDKEGTTIVLNGDAPLITKDTISSFIKYHNDNKFKTTIMTCNLSTDIKFGRIIKENNQVTGIVEYKDCNNDQINITEMNVGEYCFDNKELFKALDKVNNNNAQKEYYITDVIGIENDDNLSVGSYPIENLNEVGGINDLVDLANANKELQLRVNKEHMLNGVQIVDMNNTYIGTDVKIGTNTLIEPGCIIKGNTTIGSNVHIGPYCEFNNMVIKDNVEIKFAVLEDSIVESGTDIGPYARLRNHCHILENVHIGNFVEMKKATFGKGSKSAHLTYIGDATVGSNVNIGCGTITVNYDGKNKSQTIIDDNAFIGCNSNLVAPVEVGKGAFIAAGSTITKDVNSDAMGIARARQENKDGYAKVLEDKRNSKGK